MNQSDLEPKEIAAWAQPRLPARHKDSARAGLTQKVSHFAVTGGVRIAGSPCTALTPEALHARARVGIARDGE